MNVAGATSTLSKNPALFPEGGPRWLVQAHGSRVWDERGRQYTDWVSGLLAVPLGHAHAAVVDAVTGHLQAGGPTWSLAHPLEEEVAATIARLCGHPDWQARFFKTGSEACAAAVRVARAVTGRVNVYSVGYHGWHDTLLTARPGWGVPGSPVFSYRFNEPPSGFGRGRGRGGGRGGGRHDPVSVAAVIMEPETVELPDAGYLDEMRDWCSHCGALLIFDECITGGRYPEFTAGRHYGVEPDLYVFSKALANGFPLACVVGRPALMRCFDVDWRPQWASPDDGIGPVYCSGTYSGETASLAAAKATLRVWEREQVATRLQETGALVRTALLEGMRAARMEEVASIKGPPYRLVLECADLRVKTALQAALLRHGHLVGAGWNLMLAHSNEDVAELRGAWRDACQEARERIDHDRWDDLGRLVVQPYRQA